MAKRFTDTEKWKKQWFRELTPKMKCAWEYLRDMCDHAGVWEADFAAMKFLIGDEVTAQEIEKAFSKRLLKLQEGKKYLLLGFVKFQYVKLKDGNRTHESVRGILKADAPHVDPSSLEDYPKPYRTLSIPYDNPTLSSSEISKGLSEILHRGKDTDTGFIKDKETDTESQSEPEGFQRLSFSIGEKTA